jgi:hypothetical protein
MSGAELECLDRFWGDVKAAVSQDGGMVGLCTTSKSHDPRTTILPSLQRQVVARNFDLTRTPTQHLFAAARTTPVLLNLSTAFLQEQALP